MTFHQQKLCKANQHPLINFNVIWEDNYNVHSRNEINHKLCHTLISFGDDHSPTFGFLPAELSCLTLIVVQSVRFCDVSEGNVKNIQKEGKRVLQSNPARALDRRLQVDWARDAREGPRVLMSLRVDFGPMGYVWARLFLYILD